MKRHALFVGVDEYDDPTIQNLEFPSEDANELASVFRRQLKFDRVEKLVNPDHAPAVVDAVKDMTHGLGPGDLFLFFFAGHGFRVKENHVLVCAKDEYADLEDEYAGLPVGRLKKRMAGPWNRMLVLDACQNDIRASRGAECGVTSRDLELIHTEDAKALGSGFQIVVTSCSEGQKALEVSDLKHGLFTSAFLDSVTSFADARRRIDLEALRMDLGVRMGGMIDKYRLSGRQEPMFTMPADACGIVLLDGFAPAVPPPSAPSPVAAPTLVVCPVCGRKNEAKDTFRCRECGRDNLCLRHQDETTFLCAECTERVRCSPADEAAPTVTVAGVSFRLRRIPGVGTQSGLWMGETLVTQELWVAVMGGNPSHFKGNSRRPVENVSYNDCQAFLARLNVMDAVKEKGLVLRLPKEEEWEHACRAGSPGDYCRLADGTDVAAASLSRVARYGRLWNEGPIEVGTLETNAWGLFDMLGNVCEWTLPEDGGLPAGRGGGWFYSAENCTADSCSRYAPDFRSGFLGMRVAATTAPERND